MMTKRVYHPVDKTKIEEAIRLYKRYLQSTLDDENVAWDKFYRTAMDICPQSNCWAGVVHLFQPMRWSGTLTVDNLYYTIITSGMNQTLEDCYD